VGSHGFRAVTCFLDRGKEWEEMMGVCLDAGEVLFYFTDA
jgi:hypothetical protein